MTGKKKKREEVAFITIHVMKITSNQQQTKNKGYAIVRSPKFDAEWQKGETMGYRSQILIVAGKNIAEELDKVIAESNNICNPTKTAMEGKVKLFYWEWVKWYGEWCRPIEKILATSEDTEKLEDQWSIYEIGEDDATEQSFSNYATDYCDEFCDRLNVSFRALPLGL